MAPWVLVNCLEIKVSIKRILNFLKEEELDKDLPKRLKKSN